MNLLFFVRKAERLKNQIEKDQLEGFDRLRIMKEENRALLMAKEIIDSGKVTSKEYAKVNNFFLNK